MAILYNKEVMGIGDDGGSGTDSNKKQRPYTKYTENYAPYFSTWMDDPITRQKLESQLGQNAYNDMKKRVNGTKLFNMQAIGDMPDVEYKDFVASYNNKQGLSYRVGYDKYRKNEKVLDHFRVLGKAYDYKTGLGTRGANVASINAIATVYPLAEADKYGSVTHELTHASGLQGLMEKYIDGNWGDKKKSMKDLRLDNNYKESKYDHLLYLRGERGKEGVYPRIMQLRKIMKLKPGQRVTLDMLEKIGPEDKASPMRGLRANWTDETILDILNTVAKNDSYSNNDVLT